MRLDVESRGRDGRAVRLDVESRGRDGMLVNHWVSGTGRTERPLEKTATEREGEVAVLVYGSIVTISVFESTQRSVPVLAAIVSKVTTVDVIFIGKYTQCHEPRVTRHSEIILALL